MNGDRELRPEGALQELGRRMNQIGAIPEIGVRIREYNRLAGEFPGSSLAAFNLALDLWKNDQQGPACQAARHALAIEPALIDQLPPGLAAALRAASAGAGEPSTGRLGETVAGFRVTHRLAEDPRTQLYEVERGAARGYLRVLRRSLSQSPAVAARFVESAKLLQRISHPGLATILDAGMLADGCAYVLFQPEPGEPLSERIWREEPLAPLAPALGTLAGALATLHAQGACYLGLQPERVQVVTGTGAGAGASLQLLDSEHVRAAILQSPTPTIANGTVHDGVDPVLFMAPEVFSGRAEVGPPADVYALGALAYLVLCGQPPLAAPTIGEVIAAHLNRAPVPVRAAAPGVPEALARLVDAMLDKDPGRRPSMAAVAEAWPRSFATPAAPDPRAPAAPAEPAELTVGSMLGDYRLVKKLGEGRTGVVFEAVHERLRRRDAIKVIRPEYSRSTDDAERFLREAQAANAVAHPGILSILQQARAPNGQIYTVMELLEGGSIGDRIGDGPMPAARVQRLGRQVALAIAAAHEHGVIHRDLKPENVLLVRDPDVPGGERSKVVDFGTANLTESATRGGPYVEGTPAYMSPEQLRDTRTAGTKTDVYALGVMLQEMLAGKRRPDRTDPPASCPPWLAALARRMQDPDPARRPDMTDVAARLAEAPRARRRWIVPAAAGLAALAALAIGGLLWHRHVERSKPVAAFDHEILRFTGSSVAAQFENHTTGSRDGIAWLWTFDDGTTSTEEAPAHEFRCTAEKRQFTVSLRARNRYDAEGSTLTRQDLIRITPPPAPAPRVRATVTQGCPAGGPCEAAFAERTAPVLPCQAPCKVRFEDTSGGNLAQICWRSGTEAEHCGRSLRVDHEYKAAGTYLITRRATYDCGQARSATLQLRVTPPVLVRPPPGRILTTPPAVVRDPAPSAAIPAVRPISCPSGMVAVPAGTFQMGSPDGTGEAGEHPQHRVTLSAFCIDRTEVRVRDYLTCAAQGRCPALSQTVHWTRYSADEVKRYSPLCNGGDRPDHPANCVDWSQAAAYCAWAGKRLPTEAEWEYAARGEAGRTFAWGDEEPSARRLNACGPECVAMLKRDLNLAFTTAFGAGDAWETTSPVGAFPAGATPSGILDLTGNVWEWTSDWYGPYAGAAATDPRGPATGTTRVLRGGGWINTDGPSLRAARRGWDVATFRDNHVGFRCARTP